jgi:hypothetical protein
MSLVDDSYKPISESNRNDSVVIDIKSDDASIHVSELKGILHRPTQNDEDTEVIIKTALSIFIIIISLPFITSDIYYAYNDHSCVKEYPNKININLKMYLLLSGYMLLSKIIFVIFGIFSVSYRYSDFINVSVLILFGLLMVVYELFNVIWNIIGAIIFWGDIYKNNNCNNDVSTYIFVSLIIKLIVNLIFIINLKKNDKKSK